MSPTDAPAAPLALLLLAGAATPAASAEGAWWALTLERDRAATSTVAVENRCRRRHTFSVSVGAADSAADSAAEGAAAGAAAWLRVPAPAAPTTVRPRAVETAPVAVSSAGLAAGLYRARVEIRCLGCAREPGCSQDRDVVEAVLRVPWQEGELEESRGERVDGEIVLLVEAPSPSAPDPIAALSGRGFTVLRSFELATVGRRLVVAAGPPMGGALLLELLGVPGVLWAQPNFSYRTFLYQPPADPYRELQYALDLLGLREPQPATAGAGVRVAVIDTGIDLAHPELVGRAPFVRSLLPGDDTFPAEAHGTAVAGILWAHARNGVGIRGLAPGASLLALRACRPEAPGALDAWCSSETLVRALDLALSLGARVVNLSLGGPRDPLLALLVDEAERAGALVVAAAGNGGESEPPRYPAALPSVVSVGAVDARRSPYADGRRGSDLDLCAPGVEVLTTRPGGAYLPRTGTSMAAPHVAGALALALEREAGLLPAVARARLRAATVGLTLAPANAQPEGGGVCGAGLLDVARLLGWR